MSRVIPASDIVLNLDSKSGFKTDRLPATFSNVNLTDEGFVFNGTSSYIDCGNDISIRRQEFTISLWIKIDSSQSESYPLFISSGSYSQYKGWELKYRKPIRQPNKETDKARLNQCPDCSEK